MATGNLHEANLILKQPYSIFGIVIMGRQLGRTLGFPTANLELLEDFPLLLANGVYAAKIAMDYTFYEGMVNIGVRPTFNQDSHSIEVNIFNFSADVYGKCLQVFFIDRLRDEQKFPSLEELKKQLTLDRKKAEEILISWNKFNSNPK